MIPHRSLSRRDDAVCDRTHGESEPLTPATFYVSSDGAAATTAVPGGHGLVSSAAAAMVPGGGLGDDGHMDGADEACGLPPEWDLLSPPLAPMVESAEEILQAVEAELDQSPLFSRRSSMSLSIGRRTARAGRAASRGVSPQSSVGGASASSPPQRTASLPPLVAQQGQQGPAAPAAAPAMTMGVPQQQPQQQQPYNGVVAVPGPPVIRGGSALVAHYLQHVAPAAAAAAAAVAAAEAAVPPEGSSAHAPAVQGAAGAVLASAASFSGGGLLPDAAAHDDHPCGPAGGGGGGGVAAINPITTSTATATAAASAAAAGTGRDGDVSAPSASVHHHQHHRLGPGNSGPAEGEEEAAPKAALGEGGEGGDKGITTTATTTLPQGSPSSASAQPPPPPAPSAQAPPQALQPSPPPPPPLRLPPAAAPQRYQHASLTGTPPRPYAAPPGPGGGGGWGAGGGTAGGSVLLEKKVAIAGVRTWLQVLPDGSASIVQLDRAQLGLRYGVQLRDFRVLDPVLGATYPACLLCREGALIVNLDHIKVIITAQFALVNHSDSDKARPFTEELKRRLQQYALTKSLAAAALAATTDREGLSAPQSVSQRAPPLQQQQEPNQQHLGGRDVAARIPRLSSSPALATVSASSSSMATPALPSSRLGPQARAGGTTSWTTVTSGLGVAALADASPASASVLGHGGPLIAHVANALLSFLPHPRAGPQQQQLQMQQQQLETQPLLSDSSQRGVASGGSETAPQHAPPRPPPTQQPPLPQQQQQGAGVSELVASMPFELRALEVVLEQTVSLLDGQATELERATRTALDELTARVNPRNLERMRHLKGRMAGLDGKVDTVRGVLEKLLDDDRSMAAMNLTAREVMEQQQQQQQQQLLSMVQHQQQHQHQALAAAPSSSSSLSLYPASSITASLLSPSLEPSTAPGSATLPCGETLLHGVAAPPGPYQQRHFQHHHQQHHHPPQLVAAAAPVGGPGGGGAAGGLYPPPGVSGGGGGGGGEGGGWDPDSEEVAVVEMLLEAYFMQLGHTWQRLQSLKSYIASTEDLINLELDQQRNNLISVDLMVTFASFLLTAMSVIAGLFGMNVTNRLETDYGAFLAICVGSGSAVVGLWLLFVYAAIRYGLMNGLTLTWR